MQIYSNLPLLSVPTVPTVPTSSSDSREPEAKKESPTRDNSELIQEDIIDIDAILGDLEVLSETSETEDVAELSSVPVTDVPCDLNLLEEIVEKSEKEERKPNQLTCDETMDEDQEMAELKPPEAQEEEARTADPLPMEVQSTIEEIPPVNSTIPETKSLEKADIVEVIDDSDEEDQQPVNAAKREDVNPSLLTEMKPPKESDEPVPVIASLPEGNTEIASTVTDAIKDGELEGELKAIPANILQSILAGLPMETTVTDSEENLEEKEEDNNLISLDDYFSDSMDSHSKPSSMLSEDMVKERASGSDSALTIREDSSSPIREVVVKKMHSGACINPDCLSDEKPTTTTTLLPAPAFARSYYRCEKKNKKKKGRKAKVCEICLDECIAKYKSLWDKFEGQSLDYSDVPLPTDIEIIGSSDEEDEKQTKPPPTVIETKEEADVDKISSDLSQYLEENFESLIAEMQTKFKFQEKVLSFQDSCEKKLKEQSKELDKMFSEVNQIMGKTDGMYHQLMDVVLQIHPSLTDMLQPPPDAHHRSLAPGSNCFALWLPGQYRQARVLQWTWDFSQSNPMYEVEFDRHAVVNQTGVQIRVLSSDQLAFDHHQSDWKFHFGARVVALQPREVRAGNSGMVMDLQPNRVLVLFEDSTVKYVDRNMLRLCVTRFPSVRHASIVLDRHSKPMIRELLETATVKEFRFNTGDMVDLYLASKWFVAQVLAVDQAVVLCGIKQKRRVMYAGSPYIRPINNSYILTKSICMDGPNVTVKAEVYVSPYTQQRDQQQQQQLQQNQQQKKKLQLRVQPPRAQSAQQRNFEQRSSSSSSKNINIAYESDQAGRQSRFSVAPPQPPMAQHQQNHQHKTTNHYHQQQQHQQRYPPQQMELRQVAKKSGSAAGERTSRPRQAVGMPSQYYRHVKNMNNATIYLDEDDDKQGQVVSSVAPKKYSKPFMPHECGPACRPLVSSDLSRYNPLSKPLLSGWKRKILTTNTRAKYITYKAPCGRSLRNMYEVHHYLNVTQSPFNVDLFEFEVEVQCLSEYRVDQKAIKWQSQDLSEGREPMPISCINYYDTTLPPTCVYSTERTPTEGVDLNLDEDFLACCDCEDDCLDKERCQCWQLTIQGERMRDPDIIQDDVGYVYKRLPNPVPTGIYECNPRCRCSKNCLNRVVQHKIQLKLQVYKTANRGWGIRCLNDVPKGGFICVYAGHLLTEQKANEAGENAGDEYFAELDYIEVAERLKQGYESDVPDDWRSDTSTSSSSDSEVIFAFVLNPAGCFDWLIIFRETPTRWTQTIDRPKWDGSLSGSERPDNHRTRSSRRGRK